MSFRETFSPVVIATLLLSLSAQGEPTNAQQVIIVRHRNRVARTVAGCVVGSFFLLFIAFCIFMIHRDSRRRARAAAPTTSESRLSAPPPASGPRAAPTLRSVSVLTVGRRPLFSPWRGRRRGGGVTIVVSNSNSGGVGGEREFERVAASLPYDANAALAEIEKVSDVDLEKQALQQSAVMGENEKQAATLDPVPATSSSSPIEPPPPVHLSPLFETPPTLRLSKI